MTNTDKRAVVPNQEDFDDADLLQDWNDQMERYAQAQNLKIHRIAYDLGWDEFVGEPPEKPN
jgi:hypothetical protein